VKLSKLEVLDPRSVWLREAHDFTPWLLAHADALGEVLGIDVEPTANEHPVGSFALDLIGRDLTNDCVLIVENQLTATDHGHLGQIVTYAAGADAGTVVWMATAFREEHRQALGWLNNLSEGNARFFGVEIGAVRIADSPPAPLFKLSVQATCQGVKIMAPTLIRQRSYVLNTRGKPSDRRTAIAASSACARTLRARSVGPRTACALRTTGLEAPERAKPQSRTCRSPCR